MSKVIEITENQYNAFVNGFDLIENKSIIDEALHYLKFLDKVKFETEVTVCDYVSDMIKNIENTEFLEQNINSNNKLLKNIAWVCYMSLYTESNAFTAQLMSELRNMKCNYSNVKEKFKETVAYNNLKGIEKDLFSELASSSEYGLFLTNNFIISHYRKTSAPKLNIEQFDADRYKQMLSKWAERTLYRIAKRYYGVVQLYCDELTELYTKNNCILVH